MIVTLIPRHGITRRQCFQASLVREGVVHSGRRFLNQRNGWGQFQKFKRLKNSLDVRFGSEADIDELYPQKRTSELSRGMSALCQKRTYAVQQIATYSITSSAAASKAGGILSPSALAVFRLMTTSYLFGACTGRSPGFSPLRIRST